MNTKQETEVKHTVKLRLSFAAMGSFSAALDTLRAHNFRIPNSSLGAIPWNLGMLAKARVEFDRRLAQLPAIASNQDELAAMTAKLNGETRTVTLRRFVVYPPDLMLHPDPMPVEVGYAIAGIAELILNLDME